MNTILAILLYMQVIQCPGTYEQAQIDALQAQYQVQIQLIQNDAAQMQEVNSIYLPQVERGIVITWPEDSRINVKGETFSMDNNNTLFIKKQNQIFN